MNQNLNEIYLLQSALLITSLVFSTLFDLHLLKTVSGWAFALTIGAWVTLIMYNLGKKEGLR